MAQIGRYQLALFGWQTMLVADNFTDELRDIVQQARMVKQAQPQLPVVVYIDNLRAEPFYASVLRIMHDPQYRDFFLRDQAGFIPATTYCRQMQRPATAPYCLSYYWNWFNDSAIDYYLHSVVQPIVAQSGFDGIFFDGGDGFLRGTFQQAINVPANASMATALQQMLKVHLGMANLVTSNNKYTVLRWHSAAKIIKNIYIYK